MYIEFFLVFIISPILARSVNRRHRQIGRQTCAQPTTANYSHGIGRPLASPAPQKTHYIYFAVISFLFPYVVCNHFDILTGF